MLELGLIDDPGDVEDIEMALGGGGDPLVDENDEVDNKVGEDNKDEVDAEVCKDDGDEIGVDEENVEEPDDSW